MTQTSSNGGKVIRYRNSDILHVFFPDVKAKVGSSPFLKFATQFPLILWHPYARHYYFCVVTEKEQLKWHAVLQDCVRHANDGESCKLLINTSSYTPGLQADGSGSKPPHKWLLEQSLTLNVCGSNILGTLLSVCLREKQQRTMVEKF